MHLIFLKQVQLSAEETKALCKACLWKLKSFHSFWKMVLENYGAIESLKPVDLDDYYEETVAIDVEEYPVKVESAPKKPKTIPKKVIQESNEESVDEDSVTTPKYMCDKCGFSCASMSGLNYHEKHSHQGEEIAKKPCLICGIMVTDCSMPYHILKNHSVNPFPCDICSSAFQTEETLQRHVMRVHTKGNACQYCGKKFRNKKHMLDHEAVHTGEIRYTCEFCGLKCRSNGNYLGHKRKKHPVEYQRQKADTQAKRFLT